MFAGLSSLTNLTRLELRVGALHCLQQLPPSLQCLRVHPEYRITNGGTFDGVFNYSTPLLQLSHLNALTELRIFEFRASSGGEERNVGLILKSSDGQGVSGRYGVHYWLIQPQFGMV
jgi:hypothetical protein